MEHTPFFRNSKYQGKQAVAKEEVWAKGTEVY
jgi:hypothetical protein